MLKICLCIFIFLPALSWASGHSDSESVAATFSHFARIVELESEVTAPSSITVPYVKIAGSRVYMNGPFWELVQGWVRLYYRELQAECDNCIELTEEQFTQAAVAHPARSFLQTKVFHPAIEGIEHISVGTADIASQLGVTAGVAKVTAEVAETVVSKFVGGGGVHLVCHVLDAIILFGTRHLQTSTRAFTWAKSYDRSSLATVIRMGFVSQVVRRAQRRVMFATGPVVLDEAAMAEVDAEGPNRWWGFITPGKRAKWLTKLANADGKALRLDRREYLGGEVFGRMKRYAFLKGRKRGHKGYMMGHTEMDKALNKSVVWIMAVQENMVQRAFQPDGENPTAALSLADTVTPEFDEVRSGLAEEFAKSPERAEFIEKLLRDVDVIFQPNVPSRVRYFHAAKLEALLSGFLYGRFNAALSERGDLYGNSWVGIYKQMRLHMKAGRFGSYMLEWSDFLKLASLQTDPKRLLKHKYEAMESLLRTLKILKESGDVAYADSAESLAAFEQKMTGEYKELRTFTPWKEKRTAYSWLGWLPFRNSRPLCSDMNKEAI